MIINWEKITDSLARFEISLRDHVFELNATSEIDSLADLVKAVVSSVLEGNPSEAYFENEPGQHCLDFRPSNNGLVRVSLNWNGNPYGVFGQVSESEKLASIDMSSTDLAQTIIKLLNGVKRDLNDRKYTLEKYRFPEVEYLKLIKQYG